MNENESKSLRKAENAIRILSNFWFDFYKMIEKKKTKCSDKSCSCNKAPAYWIEIDPKNGNPIAEHGICWAYYPDDKPMAGNWIKVRMVEEDV